MHVQVPQITDAERLKVKVSANEIKYTLARTSRLSRA